MKEPSIKITNKKSNIVESLNTFIKFLNDIEYYNSVKKDLKLNETIVSELDLINPNSKIYGLIKEHNNELLKINKKKEKAKEKEVKTNFSLDSKNTESNLIFKDVLLKDLKTIKIFSKKNRLNPSCFNQQTITNQKKFYNIENENNVINPLIKNKIMGIVSDSFFWVFDSIKKTKIYDKNFMLISTNKTITVPNTPEQVDYLNNKYNNKKILTENDFISDTKKDDLYNNYMNLRLKINNDIIDFVNKSSNLNKKEEDIKNKNYFQKAKLNLVKYKNSLSPKKKYYINNCTQYNYINAPSNSNNNNMSTNYLSKTNNELTQYVPLYTKNKFYTLSNEYPNNKDKVNFQKKKIDWGKRFSVKSKSVARKEFSFKASSLNDFDNYYKQNSPYINSILFKKKKLEDLPIANKQKCRNALMKECDYTTLLQLRSVRLKYIKGKDKNTIHHNADVLELFNK